MRSEAESVKKEKRQEKENQGRKSETVNESEKEGERSAGVDVAAEGRSCDHSFLWETL